jgi:biopolymer transport protein TolQ
MFVLSAYHSGLEAFPLPIALQASIWESVTHSQPVTLAVLIALVVFSVLSWTIIFSKWSRFRQARTASAHFLRAFRKAPGLEAVAVATEQYRSSPLVAIFDFGYAEVQRQVKSRGTVTNEAALERTLTIGISEEIAVLERNMNWLATTATVTPFIGLFGTVLGIIEAFHALTGQAGSASLRAVGPGIADALIATATGLAAAIPAAVFYNYFGNSVKEFSARMEDFSLEFLNMTERTYAEGGTPAPFVRSGTERRRDI